MIELTTGNGRHTQPSDKLKDLSRGVFADVGEAVEGNKGEGIAGEKAGGRCRELLVRKVENIGIRVKTSKVIFYDSLVAGRHRREAAEGSG